MRDSLIRTRLIIILGAPFLNYWVKNQGARSFAFITNQGNRANGRPQSYGKDTSSWDVIFYELQTKSPKLRPTRCHDDLSLVEKDLPVFARSIQQTWIFVAALPPKSMNQHITNTVSTISTFPPQRSMVVDTGWVADNFHAYHRHFSQDLTINSFHRCLDRPTFGYIEKQ